MKGKEKQTMWSERVAAWKASGESMLAFASRHGWNTRQLGWWKLRLASLPADAPAMLPALLPVTVAVAQARTSGAFRLAGANWSFDLPAATPASSLA